jgi:hypothetical protein
MHAFKWFKRFRNGSEALEDEQKSGQLSTLQKLEIVAEVHSLVARHQQMSLKLLKD